VGGRGALVQVRDESAARTHLTLSPRVSSIINKPFLFPIALLLASTIPGHPRHHHELSSWDYHFSARFVLGELSARNGQGLGGLALND
jgi:hypothetical protein